MFLWGWATTVEEGNGLEHRTYAEREYPADRERLALRMPEVERQKQDDR